MASLSTTVERGVLALLAPLDRVRGRLLRALGGLVRPLVTDRALRVAVAGSAAVAVSLSLTLAAPLWLLALGPLVLGVPHLLADVRYLVVRPGHHRRRALRWAVGLPLLVAALGGGLLAGLTAAAGATLVAATSTRCRLLTLAGVAVLFVLALSLGRQADLAFAHLHNVVALALWWLWRPRTGWLAAAPVLLFVLASAALALGLGQDALFAGGPAGLGAEHHLLSLAPDAPHPWGLRLVLLFAFAQSVHYAVWLRLVPDDDRPRATPRTFAASWRALAGDFGPWPLALTAALAIGLAVWATLDLAAARDGYFRMALFHGHLELAALALVVTEGRAALGGASAARPA